MLLAHPGGPFAAKKDAGAWSIPKGVVEPGEDALAAAQREFTEETSFVATGEFVPLGDTRQASGKIVTAWAVEQDVDVSKLSSNDFSIEWPPKSGKLRKFPEIDRAEWFTLETARTKVLGGQDAFLNRLQEAVG